MTVATIIVAIVVADLAATVAALRFLVVRAWRPLQVRFAPVPPAPDAVVRRSQTFLIDRLPFVRAFDVAADEGHLHLTPRRSWRVVGARAISVPWPAVVPKDDPAHARWRAVTVAGMDLTGPRWCLDLAGPGGTPRPGRAAE